MKRILIAVALAAFPALSLNAAPFLSDSIPAHLMIAHGETIQLAIQKARFEGWIKSLRLQHPQRGQLGAHAKTQLPTITSGEVISPTITVGEAGSFPVVKVGYKTGPSGLAGLTLIFSSPSGNESLSVSYSPQDLVTRDQITFEQPSTPPNYSQPGQWLLTGGYISDYAGNFISYTQDQLAALFPSPYITVVNNGPVDITPPTVTSGQVLTPTVSLSNPLPVFEATLTGSEDSSGLYIPLVGIEPPGGSFSQVDFARMPFPIPSGTGNAYSTLFTGQPTGTWAITFYAFCDLAGNCVNDSSATDIQNLFGTTTFEVTN